MNCRVRQASPSCLRWPNMQLQRSTRHQGHPAHYALINCLHARVRAGHQPLQRGCVARLCSLSSLRNDLLGSSLNCLAAAARSRPVNRSQLAHVGQAQLVHKLLPGLLHLPEVIAGGLAVLPAVVAKEAVRRLVIICGQQQGGGRVVRPRPKQVGGQGRTCVCCAAYRLGSTGRS